MYTVDVYNITTEWEIAQALANALFHHNIWFAVHPCETNEPGQYEFEIVVERGNKKMLADLFSAQIKINARLAENERE